MLLTLCTVIAQTRKSAQNNILFEAIASKCRQIDFEEGFVGSCRCFLTLDFAHL